MLIGQMNGVKKYYGDRLILRVDDFKIYDNERIGVVGLNGSGKTTFLDILTGRILSDEGTAEIRGAYSYITQLEDERFDNIGCSTARKFGVNDLHSETISGGETTRLKIANALGKNNVLIIGDEPTCNLDREGIEKLKSEFRSFKGALLVVSHDRDFLDEICDSILEIDNGEVRLFRGNYTKYKEIKKEERERALFEYEQYISEKARLEGIIEEKKVKIGYMKNAPKRMGNSEARLHKMGDQKAKASLDRAVKNIRARIENLEVKQKPGKLPEVNVDIQKNRELYCKTVLSAEKLNKSFSDRVIFKNAEFKIFNGSRTAIVGPNGSGKTTLINMIIHEHEAIKRAAGVRMGYFSQDLNVLNCDKTLLQNIMEVSIYDETFVRILLSRLLFKREDLLKNVSCLSGGERVKASLAKIMASDFNVLILDEPTNYLDIYSMEALEEALQKYIGTVIFVSHDQRFVSNLADHIISIEDKRLICFDGTLEEYYVRKDAPASKALTQYREIVLRNRLAEVLGKLSMRSKNNDIEALDREYKDILEELKKV